MNAAGANVGNGFDRDIFRRAATQQHVAFVADADDADADGIVDLAIAEVHRAKPAPETTPAAATPLIKSRRVTPTAS